MNYNKPEHLWLTVVRLYIKEYDDDGELLGTITKPFATMQEASDYATEYHQGRLAHPGGSYQLAFTRK